MRIPGIDITKHAKIAPLTLKHSNLPSRYVKRCLEHIQYKAPNLPSYRQVTDKHIKKNFDVHRPWTIDFQIENLPGEKYRRVYVEPIKEWSVFRGDRVEILTGKDKGKQGIVCEIIQERNWVFVEGLNTCIKLKGKTNTFEGTYAQIEKPLMVTTDIALVDPGDLKPCKVSWRFNEKGEKVRVSNRTGRIIPIPILEEETFDYKTKNTYQEQSKDTTAAEVTKITFQPTLQTFAMNIMEEMGIKEDRVPRKVYWY